MNPKELHDKLVNGGTVKSQARAYADLKDRYRKQVRAKWIVYHMSKETAAKSAQLALIEDEYIDACRESEAAEMMAGIAAVEYDSAKAWLDITRTLEATKRAEMTLR